MQDKRKCEGEPNAMANVMQERSQDVTRLHGPASLAGVLELLPSMYFRIHPTSHLNFFFCSLWQAVLQFFHDYCKKKKENLCFQISSQSHATRLRLNLHTFTDKLSLVTFFSPHIIYPTNSSRFLPFLFFHSSSFKSY